MSVGFLPRVAAIGHQLQDDGRCTMSDLPPSQCAAPRCVGKATDVPDDKEIQTAVLPSEVLRRRFIRSWTTVACGHEAWPGSVAAKTARGWVCADCDPGTGNDDEETR